MKGIKGIMAKTSTKSTTSDALVDETASTSVPVTREEYESLVAQNNELKEMLNKILESKNEPMAVATLMEDPLSRMDKPITLIHLFECEPGLPTTFTVNGMPHYFTNFGETKMFRWADMSNIISRYRDWFVRGIFALGKDCEEFKYEIPSDIISVNLPENFFSKMTTLSDEEFEYHFAKLTPAQKIQVANNWRKRFMQKRPGYASIKKVRFINKETDGLLKDVVEKLNETL